MGPREVTRAINAGASTERGTMDVSKRAVVVLTRRAEKGLRALDAVDRRRALQVLLAGELAAPSNRQLSGHRHLRRRRVGQLRILFRAPREDEAHIQADAIVVAVGHRQGVYSRLPNERPVQVFLNLPAIAEHEVLEGDAVDEEEELGSHSLVDGAYLLELKPEDPDGASIAFDEDEHRRNVVLAPEQHQLVLALRTPGEHVRIFEGAPGTAKSVLAAEVTRDFLAQSPEGWAGIIAPPTLVDRLYSRVRHLRLHPHRGFLGSLEQFQQHYLPGLASRRVPDETALMWLRDALGASSGIDEVGINHLLAFQGFALTKSSGKDLVGADPDLRIHELRAASRQFELRRRRGESARRRGTPRQLLRVEVAGEWARCPPSLPAWARSAQLVVDEAQDLFKDELSALERMVQAWAGNGLDARLVLLGDANQRVYPTGFDWGVLPYRRSTLAKNYRNSRHVLEFASAVHEALKRVASVSRSRHPPPPVRPQDAAEEGEEVRLVVVDDETEAAEVLGRLSTGSPGRGVGPRRLLDELADAVKVLSHEDHVSEPLAQGLVFLPVGQAKGHEYEACVVYRMFSEGVFRSATALQACYTAVTRARTRLLVVATREEAHLMEEHGLLASLVRAETPQAVDAALSWVREFKTGLSIEDLTNAPARLLEAVRGGRPYLDTFEVLERLGVDACGWTVDALKACLGGRGVPGGAAYFCDDPLVRMLQRAAAGCSWEAAAEARRTPASRGAVVEAAIREIAAQMDAKGLVLDARRLLDWCELTVEGGQPGLSGGGEISIGRAIAGQALSRLADLRRSNA